VRLHQQRNNVIFHPVYISVRASTFEMNNIVYTLYEQEYTALHFVVGRLLSGKELRRMWDARWER